MKNLSLILFLFLFSNSKVERNEWKRSMSSSETVYFGMTGLDGSLTYTQTFPRLELPDHKAKHFWCVSIISARDHKVIPNPMNRYLISQDLVLHFNDDGSLTLVFSPTRPDNELRTNWLPTPEGEEYTLVFRFYGPTNDVIDGNYYPPPLFEQRTPNEYASKMTEWMKKTLNLNENQVYRVQKINLEYANKTFDLQKSNMSREEKVETLKKNSKDKDGELRQVFTPDQFKIYIMKKDELMQKMKAQQGAF